jgi:hypothetical protein
LNLGDARILLMLLAGLAPVWARGQGTTFTGSAEIVSAQVERMYVRGMEFLVRTQAPDGSWPDEQINGKPAVTALAVVSLLAHGDDPNFGPYKTAIGRGLDYLLKQQDAKTGYIGPTMYNHGFSTLALAESYGAVEDPRLGPALRRAVQLILNAQQASVSKAWRYSPEATDADTTVSGAQMVALMAARNAGIPVPEKSIQDGLHFYFSCQTADGGIGYINAQAPNATRTAIGCLVMALAKQKNSLPFQSAFQFLKNTPQEHEQYPAYFRYYASQAYFQASPEAWDKWNHDNINTLRASQSADGGWDGPVGPTFNTAGSLLSLALNYRYLPIYER